MSPKAQALLIFFAVVRTALGQPDESEGKPPLAVPEPQPERSVSDKFTITVVLYNEAVKQRDILSLAVPELVRFFGESTDIQIELSGNELPLYDERTGNALLLYMTGQDAIVRLNEVEKRKLGEYLRSGGLLYAEDIVSGGSRVGPDRGGGVAGTPFDRQFKALMKDPLILGNRGKRWRKISNAHPLYSNYFDFPDGPPLAGTYDGNVFSLEMLEYRGRIAVIFSDLNLSWYWATLDAEGRDRSLQFGVNLIVWALTQRFAGRPLPTSR